VRDACVVVYLGLQALRVPHSRLLDSQDPGSVNEEMTVEVSSQLQSLRQAKELLDNDPSFYPQVIRGVLPIAKQDVIELRRWIASLLASGFSSDYMELQTRQEIGSSCLEILYSFLQTSDEQTLKSSVECCASLYPTIFKYM
jgi:symplekin